MSVSLQSRFVRIVFSAAFMLERISQIAVERGCVQRTGRSRLGIQEYRPPAATGALRTVALQCLLTEVTSMKNCCAPNIDAKGRFARACFGTLLVIGGLLLALAGWRCSGVLIILAGGFAWFEALRGWCVMRACGFKTKW